MGTWGAGAGKPSFCCSSPGGEGEGEGVSLVSTAVVAGVRETSQSANNGASFRGGGVGGNFVPPPPKVSSNVLLPPLGDFPKQIPE